MQNPNLEILFSDAEQLLHDANEEMSRPKEDVVAHLVCKNSRQSIINYLSGYLLEKGISLASPATIDNLSKQCKAIDVRFEALNLSSLKCRFETHDKDYCTNIEKVGECLHIAKQTKELAKHKLLP